MQLPGPQKIVCHCIKCFHTLLDIGYVLCETKLVTVPVDAEAETKYNEILNQCKVDQSAGREIGAMLKAGRVRRQQVVLPRVAFLCDTTPQVFGSLCSACETGNLDECAFKGCNGSVCEKNADIRHAQRKLLLSCQCIIVECSFIGAAGMSDVDAENEAVLRGHTSWTQLRPHVETNSK